MTISLELMGETAPQKNQAGPRLGNVGRCSSRHSRPGLGPFHRSCCENCKYSVELSKQKQNTEQMQKGSCWSLVVKRFSWCLSGLLSDVAISLQDTSSKH